MTSEIRSIPRPLVRTNQWVILLSVASALLTGQMWILVIPLTAGLLGLLFNFNPVMRLAKLFLKKKPSDYIPEDHSQQQFNQAIAVVCLGLGFISFLLGWDITGYIFTLMVGLASLIAILGFCIGCYILYQWKQYSYRRSIR
jgi:CHASE2 domain-containing sensor protein